MVRTAKKEPKEAKDSSGTKRGRPSASSKLEQEEVSQADTRNFLTQLKNPKGENVEEKSQLYAIYSNLSRFDHERKEIIEKWKKDKSCKWWQEYSHVRTKGETKSRKGLAGFGTKRH
jgi:hypothetical protein